MTHTRFLIAMLMAISLCVGGCETADNGNTPTPDVITGTDDGKIPIPIGYNRILPPQKCAVDSDCQELKVCEDGKLYFTKNLLCRNEQCYSEAVVEECEHGCDIGGEARCDVPVTYCAEHEYAWLEGQKVDCNFRVCTIEIVPTGEGCKIFCEKSSLYSQFLETVEVKDEKVFWTDHNGTKGYCDIL